VGLIPDLDQGCKYNVLCITSKVRELVYLTS